MPPAAFIFKQIDSNKSRNSCYLDRKSATLYMIIDKKKCTDMNNRQKFIEFSLTCDNKI